MAGVAALVASAVISETINQTVSKTFSNGLDVFQGIDTKKKILILLTNDTVEDWTEAQVYLHAGTSNGIPPKVIKSKSGGTYILRRSKTPMLFGSGDIRGVLTYKINTSDVLAIYFKVPIDNHFSGKNCWNVKIYTKEEIDNFRSVDGDKFLEKLYARMKDDRSESDNSYNYPKHEKYEIKVIMSTSARCKYRVDIANKSHTKSDKSDEEETTSMFLSANTNLTNEEDK